MAAADLDAQISWEWLVVKRFRVRVNTTQNLNLDPNPQNEIIEGHP